MAGEERVSSFSFWVYTIGYLMASMLLSIVVGEQSYEIGVKILEAYPVLQLAYALMKIILGLAYLMLLNRNWIEILLVLCFALCIRAFAEGTFTIVLIGAMMAQRWTSKVKR
jgi:hypothetical protein|tara:strand:+ start:426 stop:761 length:336 start_codon:yes stop_codon:yes gene_type:complete